jgi:hypothetical protein
LEPDGTFDSKTVMALFGQTVTYTMVITPDTEGRWLKVIIDSPTRKSVFQREEKTIRLPDQASAVTEP